MRQQNENIVFLHLSDMHISSEKDISDLHLCKIVNALNSYKDILIKDIIMVISGDLTQSGEKSQFNSVRKIVGTLIKQIREKFGVYIHVLVVPGNHDVMHGTNILDIQELKDNNYNHLESQEQKKLVHFYDFSNYNGCFCKQEVYCDKKILNLKGFMLQVNLVNNAIFSTRDEYKGLLYFPSDKIDVLADTSKSDFVITIMHHAPDFYRDDIKTKVEEIISKSSVLFYGHEHRNSYKRTSYEGASDTIIQLGGSLCNEGDWNGGSFIIGILNRETMKYSHHKFVWNMQSKQYEHGEMKKDVVSQFTSQETVDQDFIDSLCIDFKNEYFVFPSMILHTNKPENDKQIETINCFLSEVMQYQNAIITGPSNIGKSTLLKQLFFELIKSHTVIFCSPDMILRQSKGKRQKIDKLIHELFKEIYGSEQSKWQAFEQSNKNECVFILDDFDLIDGIDISEFMNALSSRFGTIIMSTSQIIDFNPESILDNDANATVKFEIKPPLGNKRKEIIEAVVRKSAVDKAEPVVANIVHQINQLIKSQINLIPPEPYFIVQVSENFLNSVGEVVNNSTVVFSKVFEANITNKIDSAIKKQRKDVSVELMYVILGKIAHYIHFNKAYPISRSGIDHIVRQYNEDYGNDLVTEDIITIAKKSKILLTSNESSESFRFRNKSVLAYFVAKEIITRYGETKDGSELEDVINKCCMNICTDILLFIIFLTDDISILKNIMSFIDKVISTGDGWEEISIPNNLPNFLKNYVPVDDGTRAIRVSEEKKELEKTEEKAEEMMVREFRIKDIYDWEDSELDEFNNKLIRMTSLLQILSKSLPCFEHKLLKKDKKQLIKILYQLPNRIFMFWSKMVDESYSELIEELKLHPYLASRKNKMMRIDIDTKAKELFSVYALNLLLNLYYVPVVNATGRNTNKFLCSIEYFDYSQNPTYQLEHLMMKEQITENDDFVKDAIRMKDEFDDYISGSLLRWIVRHGIITRNDKRENIDRLESKFFSKSKKPLLIERAKNKSIKE